jgi:putative hemolysin
MAMVTIGRRRRDLEILVNPELAQLDGIGSLMIPGEVSHLNLRTFSISDPPWNATAARLVRMSRAPVVPMYFGGANSALFQLAGIVPPRLRRLLLPHEASEPALRVLP